MEDNTLVQSSFQRLITRMRRLSSQKVLNLTPLGESNFGLKVLRGWEKGVAAEG